jgi:hypothetical protein
MVMVPNKMGAVSSMVSVRETSVEVYKQISNIKFRVLIQKNQLVEPLNGPTFFIALQILGSSLHH